MRPIGGAGEGRAAGLRRRHEAMPWSLDRNLAEPSGIPVLQEVQGRPRRVQTATTPHRASGPLNSPGTSAAPR